MVGHRRSGLKSVAESAHRDDMAWVGGVTFDLGSKATNMYVDQAAVPEIPVTPHVVQKMFATEDAPGILRQFAEQTKFGFGEVEFGARPQNLAFVGNDFEIPEHQFRVSGMGRAGPTKKRANSGRQFFGGKGFGEVIVGASFESGDHIVRIGAGRNHDDRNIARAADRTTQFEAVDTGEHDVDENHIGGLAQKQNDGFFATSSLVDRPALVFESEFYCCSYALIVFDRKDPCSHGYILPDGEGVAGTTPCFL